MKISLVYFSTDGIVPPVSVAGGKGHHLFQLQLTGCNVPDFLVIPVETIRKNFTDDQPADPELMRRIRSRFAEGEMLAVRSSCVQEDGADHSFAGLFETHLFVPVSQLEEHIRAIAQSVFADRVTEYRKNKGIEAQAEIAVVVQKMIEADVSGVAFGWHPLKKTSGEKAINAVWGLGEGLVSGLLDSDLYEINQKGDVHSTLARKDRKMVWNKELGSGTTLVDVPENEINEPCLSKEQCRQIADVLDQLEKHYGQPQDIEFAWKDGVLFLLQSRPISTMAKPEAGPRLIWDNSNIVESYPGLTLPLTFSFITKMYEAVYRQLSRVMGVPQEKIDRHSDEYASMLGLLKGRVYYNLNSWFRSLSLLPGYALNVAFMEKMMGVKEPFPIPMEVETQGFQDYVEILLAISGIIRNLVSANKERVKFQAYFQSVMDEYEQIDFSKCTSDELRQLYLRFELTLVKEWKAPLVNDFFAMVFFGLLQKQTQKWVPDAGLHNDLLIGSYDIITTQPAERTVHISSVILENPEARSLFLSQQPAQIWQLLTDGALPEIHRLILDYIKDWGDRSVGELKLETETYRQKPADYIQVLKNYVAQGKLPELDKSLGQKIRKEAEAKMDKALKGKWIARFFYQWIVKKARYFVSQRENLRYERTRGFGMVRRLFLALGERLASQHLLAQLRDIFYLTQEEIFQGLDGQSFNGNWKSLVDLRKAEYTGFAEIHLPERLETYGAVQAFLDTVRSQAVSDQVQSDLKGMGCCAGIVRARIQVLTHPSEVESLQGKILVTSSTDPGWVTLFPTCSGILVERGSLLSHSAIVSREMGIPCVVGIRDLLRQVETGWLVEMDGEKGTIHIIDKNPT